MITANVSMFHSLGLYIAACSELGTRQKTLQSEQGPHTFDRTDEGG